MKRFILILSVLAMAACSAPDASTLLPRDNSYADKASEFDRIATDMALCGATNELHGIVVLKDGKVIYEYYDKAHAPGQKHVLWSASKTFTATAIGFAVQEGLLSVQDPVSKFFPDEMPANPSDTLSGLTVWNLLTMSSGVNYDPVVRTGSGECDKTASEFLSSPFLFVPGEKFHYNSHNTYMLSAIVTKLTGKTVAEYLDERLFSPLGIRNYCWEESAEGYSMGGWGLWLSTEDLAKAGQFFLQRGKWDGKQLLQESWFDEAMSVQIMQTKANGNTDEENAARALVDESTAGYGYQMWRCCSGNFRFDGAWGQFSIICPEKNVVIAINGVCAHTGHFLKYVKSDILDKI